MFFLGLYDTTVGGRCDLLGVEHTVGWGIGWMSFR